MTLSLTAFQGRAGDRNDLGIPGALSLASALAHRLALPLAIVGSPQPALNTDWKTELAAAAPDLRKLADHVAAQLLAGSFPVTVLNRCAAAIATIPRIVDHCPDVCVVWFDAHADLNTPTSSASGYLGGLALSASVGLWDSGFGGNLPLANIVLVGSRDLDPFEAELVASGKVWLIAPNTPNLADAVVLAIANRPVYVHLDCDVLEPGLVPTDFCVDGGLSLQSLHTVFSALSTTNVIGWEIAEFQDAWGPGLESASPTGLIDAIQPLLTSFHTRRPRQAVSQ
ncbi:MAG: arginase family protein [Pseudomonadota bacterium]